MTEYDIARAETVGFSQMVLPASMLAKGHRVGPYEIIGAIGRGGVGAVYHARVAESCALTVGREVALKILRQEHLSESDLRRFTREAAYLQALSHHSITRIYDVGDYGGRPYLVMELIKGQCLDELIGRDHQHPLPAEHAADLVIQALEGLHVAHIAGITHRDLKPGNLMITPQGEVKILDFGMAQRISGESRLTASGSILGTPAYMSPEQARGMRDWISAPSDIYSMGAVLYELVTGYQPFRAENSVAVLRAIIEEPLTAPSTLVNDFSPNLETIILRAMAKDPRDRYASAEAMAEDLRRFRRGLKPKAQRLPFWRPWLRTLYFYRRVFAVVSLIAFIIMALALAITLRSLREQVLPPLPADEASQPTPWITVWNHPESLGQSIAAAASWDRQRFPGSTIYSPVSPDNRDRLIAVESDLQITFTLNPTPRNLSTNEELIPTARILFSDREIGEGYVLSITDQLTLYRPRIGGMGGASDTEDTTSQLAMVSSTPRPWANEAVDLLVQREDNVISVYRLANQEADQTAPTTPVVTATEPPQLLLRYIDLIPLEGSDHTRIHFILPTDDNLLANITVNRRPREELVSRLELGDALRQDGQYERAERFYRDFIRDFPNSDRIRDARYRQALCLVALRRYNDALTIFLELAESSTDDPLYWVSSSFQAWQCALRLGRFVEADRYFESIRSRYDLNTLLAYASQDLLKALPQRYLESAFQQVTVDPFRSVSLYQSAGAIAEYLQQPESYGAAQLGASDVLVSLSEWTAAEELLQSLIAREQLSHNLRQTSLLRLAQIERLRGNFISAEDRYRDFFRLSQVEDQEEVLWAKLWLADLYTAMNRHQDTYLAWRELADFDHPAGSIARNLLGPLDELPLDGSAERINDIAYFNAVAGALDSDRDRFEEWFQAALSVSDLFEWPQPLLNDAWESEVHLMETWYRYPPRLDRGQDEEPWDRP